MVRIILSWSLILLSGYSLADIKPKVEYRDSETQNQSKIGPNRLYIEMFGNAFYYSINYDRLIFPKTIFRVGYSRLKLDQFSMGSVSTADFKSTLVPITVSYLFNSNQQQLEIGGGVVPSRESYIENGDGDQFKQLFSIFATGIWGYRFQNTNSPISFRLAYTPMIGLNNSLVLLTMFGASIGYSF